MAEDRLPLEEGNEEEPIWWVVYRKEIGEVIKKVLDLMEWYPKQKAKQNLIVTGLFVGLLTVVMIIMGLLTSSGIVSGDAFVFLIGTFVGYVFAFLHKYLGLGIGG